MASVRYVDTLRLLLDAKVEFIVVGTDVRAPPTFTRVQPADLVAVGDD